MNLLQTKLRPPLSGQGVIARPQLLSVLRHAVLYPLSLLIAPAGSGKTTLLAAWAGQEPAVGWFTIDREDNDPARFWTHLLAAVQTVYPDLSLPSAIITPEMGSALLTSSLNEISNRLAGCGKPIFLVLDNYHNLENTEIQQGIRYWVDHQPANTHLVIASRTHPPLRLASLRAKNRVGEVPAELLHFSSEDVRQFFQSNENRVLSEAQIQQVMAATEGWAAGVRMLAFSFRGQTSAFASGNKDISEYLVDEVINQIPEQWQQFMSAVSVVESMDSKLCAALSGDSNAGDLLDQIEQANIFINRIESNREGAENRYQFQPFFREALLSRLSTAEQAALHQKAAVWFDQNGAPEAALQQAQAGKDWMLAARLILDLAEMRLQQGEIRTLQGWFQALPEAIRQKNSGLQVLYGWVLYLTGQVPEALQMEQRLIEEKAAMPPPVLGWWNGLRCQLALVQEQNIQAAALAKTALIEISETSLFFRGMLLNSLANALQATGDSEGAIHSLRLAVEVNRKTGNLFGTAFAQATLGLELNNQGKRNRAEAVCQEAIEAFRDEQGQLPPQAGILFVLLAQLLRETNQLEAASQALTAGIEMVDQLGIPGLQLSGLLVQAQILAAQEHDAKALAEAQRLLNRACRLSRSAEFTGFRRLFEMMRAEIFLKSGSLAGVENWLEEASLPEQIEADPARETEYLLRARYRIEMGQLDLAQDELTRLETYARQAYHHRLLIQVLLAQAIADWKQGETSALKSRLEEALKLAGPEKYLRLLLDDGAPVVGLLAQLPGAPAEIRMLFRAQGKLVVPALGETLTAREVDVLRLLAENQTNAEIAQRLVVSNETVKVHLKHIFQKLEVTDRRQAVSRARELGLID